MSFKPPAKSTPVDGILAEGGTAAFSIFTKDSHLTNIANLRDKAVTADATVRDSSQYHEFYLKLRTIALSDLSRFNPELHGGVDTSLIEMIGNTESDAWLSILTFLKFHAKLNSAIREIANAAPFVKPICNQILALGKVTYIVDYLDKLRTFDLYTPFMARVQGQPDLKTLDCDLKKQFFSVDNLRFVILNNAAKFNGTALPIATKNDHPDAWLAEQSKKLQTSSLARQRAAAPAEQPRQPFFSLSRLAVFAVGVAVGMLVVFMRKKRVTPAAARRP